MGEELQVAKKSDKGISLKADSSVLLKFCQSILMDLLTLSTFFLSHFHMWDICGIQKLSFFSIELMGSVTA